MNRIFYALHFTGKAVAADGDASTLRTTGTATSCVLRTLIGRAGFHARLQPSGGDLAFLESAMHFTGPASFEEKGTISIGSADEHELRFATLEAGHLAPSPEPGSLTGMARWEIEGGRGQFAGARGFISSSFILTSAGQLDQFHSGLIFLP